MASAPPASDPVPAPPAVEVEVEVKEKERPWPLPMKMKLAPYAMYRRVFRGMGPVGDDVLAAAYVGIHVLLYVVQFLSLSAVPERARFWALIQTVVVSACIAANALIIGLFIRNYYMDVDAVYAVKGFDPSKQQQAEAAASDLLPPPPPEMDIC